MILIVHFILQETYLNSSARNMSARINNGTISSFGKMLSISS